MAEEALILRIQAICQSLAYGVYDSGKSFPIIGEVNYPTMYEKNLIIETLHAMNRQTPTRESVIPNHLVKTAIGYTLHWLKYKRLPVEEQKISNIPEWGKEYR